jgi:hypothetical protein
MGSSPTTRTSRACCLPRFPRCAWSANKSEFIPGCERDNLLSTLDFVSASLTSVPWTIFYGTLLGSMRSGRHIPHETDIDVSIDAKHWSMAIEQLSMAARTHANIKLWVEPKGHRFARVFFSAANSVHTDIWSYERGTVCSFFGSPHVDGGKGIHIENRLLFPYARCKYEHGTYPCPHNALAVVEQMYGAAWLTPKRKYGVIGGYTDSQFGYNKAGSCGHPRKNGPGLMERIRPSRMHPAVPGSTSCV